MCNTNTKGNTIKHTKKDVASSVAKGDITTMWKTKMKQMNEGASNEI